MYRIFVSVGCSCRVIEMVEEASQRRDFQSRSIFFTVIGNETVF